MKDLKIRHGLGELDKETYDLTFDHLNKQMMEVNRELENCIPKKSNIEKVISKSLAKLRKTSTIWTSCNLDSKRRTQKILFPEGIFYNAKKHEHLTPIKSLFIVLTDWFSVCYAEKKEGTFQEFLEKSLSVAGTRQLLNRLYHDLTAISQLQADDFDVLTSENGEPEDSKIQA